MGTDTGDLVYFIRKNRDFAWGTVNYMSGEFYSDAHDFATKASTQSGSVRQLSAWMESMEKEGYFFHSVEEEIDAL